MKSKFLSKKKIKSTRISSDLNQYIVATINLALGINLWKIEKKQNIELRNWLSI